MVILRWGVIYSFRKMKRERRAMTDEQQILDLLARWDGQQEGCIQQREERFDVMFEILSATHGDGFTVVDAACGPGSLSQRLLKRFPAVRVIALDADVMLLEMARVALAPYAARVRVVEADLADPSWTAKVMEAARSLSAPAPAALVSTTALHWLSPGDLAEFYDVAGEFLVPGGIVMNGDHMRFDAHWPTLKSVAGIVRQRAEHEAVKNGEDDWAAWWERAGQIPRLAPLKAARDAFYAARPAKRAASGEDCSVDLHVAALRHSGFTEVGTAWQMLDNYIVFGRRP